MRVVHIRTVFASFLIIVILCMPVLPIQTSNDSATNGKKTFAVSQLSVIERFSDNLLLSTNDDNYPEHVEPTLTISDQGVLFVGWKNAYTPEGGGVRVSFTRSEDGGNSWTDPIDMPMIGGLQTRQSDPWLIWSNDVLYYAYLEFNLDNLSQITIAHSYDNGSSWTPVVASYGDYFADKETMTITENGTIYVAYDDVDTSSSEGPSTVRLTGSTDAGPTFRELSVIGEPDPGNLGPYITSNDDDLYVAYTYFMGVGGNIIFKKSVDGGISWSDGVFVNDDGNFSHFTIINDKPSKLTLPVIRFDNDGRMYILWSDTFDKDNGSFDVYLRYSDDFGATWSDRIRINPDIAGDQWEPDMDIDSEGRLHIVYYDERGRTYKTYYRMLEFTGDGRDNLVMTDPIPIATEYTSSDFSRPGDYCTIRVDQSGIPHVVWSDGRNDEMDIYYSHGQPLITTTTSPAQQPTNNLIVVSIIVIAFIAVIVIIYLKRVR